MADTMTLEYAKKLASAAQVLARKTQRKESLTAAQVNDLIKQRLKEAAPELTLAVAKHGLDAGDRAEVRASYDRATAARIMRESRRQAQAWVRAHRGGKRRRRLF